MSRLTDARAWRIEIQDADGGVVRQLSESGDIDSAFPGYRMTLTALRTACEDRFASFGWIDSDSGASGKESAAESVQLFHFISPVGQSEMLTGVVVIDRNGFSGSTFGSETQFVGFLRGLAANVSRERRLENEEWAMRQLLSSLAIQCILVDRSGKIILQTVKDAADVDESDPRQRRKALRTRGIIKTILAQYSAKSNEQARSLTVATISGQNGEQTPLYIMPLTKNSDKSDPELLALLLPRSSAPPSTAALAASLSLTVAEAKVVQRMTAGKNIRRIAEEMSLTEQTVRTYLKRTYAKLGVSSQCELIARVTDVSIPLARTKGSPNETTLDIKP